jgi:hypothetical protein
MTDEQGVYGGNHPTEEDTGAPDIREEIANNDPDKGVGADLDAARQDQIDQHEMSGGMGRQGTPKEATTPGSFGHDEPEPTQNPS